MTERIPPARGHQPNVVRAVAVDARPGKSADVVFVQAPAPVNLKVFVQKPHDEHAFLNASTYAPAVPGVAVALFGLYGAHKLSQWRDRDKAINEMCLSLKKIAEDAATSAADAWSSPADDARLSKVYIAKQKIQSVGIAATNLLIRSERHGKWQLSKVPWRDQLKTKSFGLRRSIAVTKEVSSLRRACTSDPFEDPARQPDHSRTIKITKALGGLTSQIDRQLTDYEA